MTISPVTTVRTQRIEEQPENAPVAVKERAVRVIERDPAWRKLIDDSVPTPAVAPARTSLRKPALSAELVGFVPTFIEANHGSILIKGSVSAGRPISIFYDKDADRWTVRDGGRRHTMSPAEKSAVSLALEVHADVGTVDEDDARFYDFAAEKLRPKKMTLLQFRTLAYDMAAYVLHDEKRGEAALDALGSFDHLVIRDEDGEVERSINTILRHLTKELEQ